MTGQPPRRAVRKILKSVSAGEPGSAGGKGKGATGGKGVRKKVQGSRKVSIKNKATNRGKVHGTGVVSSGKKKPVKKLTRRKIGTKMEGGIRILKVELPRGLSIGRVKREVLRLRKEMKRIRTMGGKDVLGTGFGEKAQALKVKQVRLKTRIERHIGLCENIEVRIILNKILFELKKDMIQLDEKINRRYFSLLFELNRDVGK